MSVPVRLVPDLVTLYPKYREHCLIYQACCSAKSHSPQSIKHETLQRNVVESRTPVHTTPHKDVYNPRTESENSPKGHLKRSPLQEMKRGRQSGRIFAASAVTHIPVHSPNHVAEYPDHQVHRRIPLYLPVHARRYIQHRSVIIVLTLPWTTAHNDGGIRYPPSAA